LYWLLKIHVTRYAEFAKEIGSVWQMKTARIVETEEVFEPADEE
jgi:hypothetical protein